MLVLITDVSQTSNSAEVQGYVDCLTPGFFVEDYGIECADNPLTVDSCSATEVACETCVFSPTFFDLNETQFADFFASLNETTLFGTVNPPFNSSGGAFPCESVFTDAPSVNDTFTAFSVIFVDFLLRVIQPSQFTPLIVHIDFRPQWNHQL